MTIAEALQQKIAGKTKAQAARELGMTWPTLHRIVTGQRNAGHASRSKIAARFPELAPILLGQEERAA